MVQIYNKQLLELLPIRPRCFALQMLQHVKKIFKVSALAEAEHERKLRKIKIYGGRRRRWLQGRMEEEFVSSN